MKVPIELEKDYEDNACVYEFTQIENYIEENKHLSFYKRYEAEMKETFSGRREIKGMLLNHNR